MNVGQVYTAYMTPKNLQEHMLRTASLAEILLEYWIGEEVDKKAIVQTCLFHDIAKPINFSLEKQAQYGMSAGDIKKLENLQNRLKKDFGNEEHHATVMICKEIGLSNIAVKLVDNLEWKYIPRLLKDNDIASLIPIYCDMRISPKGILILEDRLRELKERVSGDDYAENVRNGKLLEEKIKENVNLDLNSITDSQIQVKLAPLLNLAII